ncbi:acylamino-acid-releasing enzyme-like [Rhinatrema bivittatum]|uniref:acylamino-acid-releasing enzyme-like n=1 Tax=Rhinatrema bivittatum TaxID=194408 RepID=UPI00112B820B|nr:acylamino-acid-releasing enzyme-like [Rhinatrema bivittatum]
MSGNSEKISAMYKELSQFPSVSRAYIGHEVTTSHGSKHCSIYTEWWQRDLERSQRLKFCRQYSVFHDGRAVEHVAPTGTCSEIQSELLSRESPSGVLRAVLRSTTGQGKEKEFLEIWQRNRKIKSLNLTALDKHGKVYADDQFGCLEWSHSENHLLYVAEKKCLKMESFFQSKAMELVNRTTEEEEEPRDVADIRKGDQFVLHEDWGEGLVNKSIPALCVLDIESSNISVLEGVPDYISPGQALWLLDDSGIVFVGWWHEPFRLGLKFCSNRRSALFHLNCSSGHCELMSRDTKAVCSPRLSPDGRRIVYLERDVFGPHHQCLKLCMYNWHLKTFLTVVDIVRRPKTGFSGIYVTALPLLCWSADSRRVLMHTPQKSRKDILIVDTETGVVGPLTAGSEEGSWTLLTIQRDLIVVSCSAPNCPPSLKIGFLPSAGKEQEIAWVCMETAETLQDFGWKIFTFQPPDTQEAPKYAGLTCESLLLLPRQTTEGRLFPLIVIPHGGPHSSFDASWQLFPAVFCRLGFAVLMVNYRGSTGFGQDSIELLLGRVGEQDVQDVQFCVEQALKTEPLDPARLALFGGSHGGFLCCHLIGQFPGMYKVCAVRNPAVNYVSLIGSSDIPDWRYSAIGYDYTFGQIPLPDTLTAMITCSPITSAGQVTAPVLMLLGEKDRRISAWHGMEYYRALRARGIPVRVLWYPDDHSLCTVAVEADAFVNSVLWIIQKLSS